MSNSQYRFTYVAVFMVIFIFLFKPILVHAQSGNVVLWNKLGSVTEITNSEVGSNGIVGQGESPIVFEPVKFGNGINVQGTMNDFTPSYVTFDLSNGNNLSGNKGSLTFWVKPSHDSNYSGISRWISST